MILIIEPWLLNERTHVDVNAAFLCTCRAAWPDQEIVFAAGENHLGYIRHHARLRDIEKTEFIGIANCTGRNRMSWRAHWRLLLEILKLMRQYRPRAVIFTSMQVYRLHFMVKTLAQLNPETRVALICHWFGLLAVPAATEIPGRGLHGLFARWQPRNVIYLGLGPHLVSYCETHLPHLKGRMRWLHMPTSFPAERPVDGGLSAPVSFGFLGFGSTEKGPGIFEEIASTTGDGDYSARARFVHVGAGDVSLISRRPFSTAAELEQGMLSRAMYEEELGKLDYCLFPYDSSVYADRASAALFDAISWRKPVIALRGPLFESYFELLGDIGYLCDSEQEMREAVRVILRDLPVQRHARQVENLARAEDEIGQQGTAVRLRDMI